MFFFRIIRLDWFCFIYYIHLGHTFLVALKARFHNENVYFFAKAIIDFILSGWHKLTCKIYFHNCFLLFRNKIKMSGYFFRIVKLFFCCKEKYFLRQTETDSIKDDENDKWNLKHEHTKSCSSFNLNEWYYKYAVFHWNTILRVL